MPRTILTLSSTLALYLLLLYPVAAQPDMVKEVVLKNGLKVLLLENHKSPAVTFQVWYRVGSRNEKDGKSGLSHFLEHMMFKGSTKIAPDEYFKIISRNGGRANAFTSRDTTVYFATMSREKIGIGIGMEADRMVGARMGRQHFEAEIKVVMEERRLRTEDNPSSALAEATGAVAYTIHPYRRPVIGWMEDLRNLSVEDLRSYYRTYYSPNNAFVVAVGDFSPAKMLEEIKSSFGSIPRGPDPPKVDIRERVQRGERRIILKKEAELPFLLMYYHAPNLNDPEGPALDLLSIILGGGRSSRLFRDLVYDKRLARRVSADYKGLAVDPTTFSISAQVMPGKDPADVERAIDQLLDQIKSEPIPERELQKAKNQVEASFIFQQDSISGQARRIGYFEISGAWQRMGLYLDGIRRLTAADLMRGAQKYLHPDRRTVGIMIPNTKPSTKKDR